MSIAIIGQILGSQGYSIHTRELANALSKIEDVRLSCPIPPGAQFELNDKELEMLKKQPKEEINLIITNPLHWRSNCTAKRNWAYLVWEGDKVPECFIEECLNPDIEYIIVPSEHTKSAIHRTMIEWMKKPYGTGEKEKYGNKPISEKIKIIPHGVDLAKFYPKEKPTKCTFLANKGFRNLEDRGGIQYLIDAYLQEFTNEEVELILKINPAYGIPDVMSLIDQIKPNKKHYPKITLITEYYKYEDLVNLYNKANIFVSPTRAEAFNIPCLEAMSCGLPVITTNYGGQTDYVNEENGYLVDYRLVEVKHELIYEGIKWAKPKIVDLRKKLRKAFNEFKSEDKKQKSLEMARQLTWDHTAHLIKQLV